MSKRPRNGRGFKWLRDSDLVAFTRTEVSECLGLDLRTVSRAVEEGQLPSVQVGRRVLIPRVPLLQKLGIDPIEPAESGSPATPAAG